MTLDSTERLELHVQETFSVYISVPGNGCKPTLWRGGRPLTRFWDLLSWCKVGNIHFVMVFVTNQAIVQELSLKLC
jgi:hypothetical protein